MTLEKRIDLMELELKHLNSMREKYKNPKQIEQDIKNITEILGYLKELQELRQSNSTK